MKIPMLFSVVLNKLDPLQIVEGAAFDGEWKLNPIADPLGLPYLFQLLKRFGIYICLIAIAITLMGMYFTNRANMGEKKERLIHVLKIMFLIFSLIGIMNILHNVFSGIF